MMRLIDTELRRLVRKPWNKIVVILMAVLLVSVYFAQETAEDTARSYISPEYRITQAEDKIRYLNMQIFTINSDANRTPIQKKQAIAELEEDIRWKEKEIEFAKSVDPSIYAEEEKERINLWELKSLAQLKIDNPVLKDKFEAKRIYVDAIHNSGYYYDTLAYSSGQTYILNILNALSVMFFGVIMVIMGSDIISGEYPGNKIVRLSRIPLSRFRTYMGKLIALFLGSIGLFYGGGILGTVITTLLRGFGPTDFPMEIANRSLSVPYGDGIQIFPDPSALSIVPAQSFVTRAVLMQILFVLVLVTFITMLSAVLKKTPIVIGVFIVLYMITNMLSGISPGLSRLISPYWFMTYANTHKVLDGRQAIDSLSPNVNHMTGLIVLIVSGILFILIGYHYFRKNGFLPEKEVKVRSEGSDDEVIKRITTAADY